MKLFYEVQISYIKLTIRNYKVFSVRLGIYVTRITVARINVVLLRYCVKNILNFDTILLTA